MIIIKLSSSIPIRLSIMGKRCSSVNSPLSIEARRRGVIARYLDFHGLSGKEQLEHHNRVLSAIDPVQMRGLI